jgi:molybdate transport system regulatory protein
MPASDHPEASLEIRRGAGRSVGRDRIRLLAAIAAEGTISAAAAKVGVTFRAAWDAVQALNNLFPEPLVIARAGGAKGGAAVVTRLGYSVMAGYQKLDAELNALMGRLDGSLLGEARDAAGPLIWSLGMRTSARNALRGVVEDTSGDAVDAEVALRVSPSTMIKAMITRSSAEELDLRPGREAVALIKASLITLTRNRSDHQAPSDNQIKAVVIRHECGSAHDEVVLEFDLGKTLVVSIPRGCAEQLGLAVGDEMTALIAASNVIVAVD